MRVDAMSTHPDAKRSRLRAWQRLVAGLDLGREPDVRTCPRCGAIGMRAAARCGHCWVALV